jgi:hypothetical protein
MPHQKLGILNVLKAGLFTIKLHNSFWENLMKFMSVGLLLATSINLANAVEVEWCPINSNGQQVSTSCWSSLDNCQRMEHTDIYKDITCIAVPKK